MIGQSVYATVYSKGNFWICSGHCASIPQQSAPGSTLYEHLLASHESEKWCFEHIKQEDNGRTIAKAISDRCAIAVSDGSLRDNYGTAAWVIEGDNCVGRIIGRNISPGSGLDQSPYRSELTGIYAVMKFIGKLCECYNIAEGFIELACENPISPDELSLQSIHQACVGLESFC